LELSMLTISETPKTVRRAIKSIVIGEVLNEQDFETILITPTIKRVWAVNADGDHVPDITDNGRATHLHVLFGQHLSKSDVSTLLYMLRNNNVPVTTITHE
jgi:hypothetical protein